VSDTISDRSRTVLDELGVTNGGQQVDEVLTTLQRRERELGENLQYELLGAEQPTEAPASTASLLAESVETTSNQLDGNLDIYLDQSVIYPSKPHINPLGVAELQVMRKTLDRYEMTDIAHVENVLEGERRERTHRSLERSEEFVGTETETVKEKKRSLETTEQFELETETSKTIEKERSIEAGVQISASYGPSVSMKSNLNYSQRTAKREKERTSERFAREITKKTVNRIKRRIKKKEWEKTIEEIEETNIHEIDNSDGDDHVIGIYRWLDKYFDAQVFNYGRRMLLEFIVPEPAAFYRYSRATDAAESVNMEKPTPPKISEAALDVVENPENPDPAEEENVDLDTLTDSETRSLRPTDLHGWNYTYYVQQYGAEASPPPRKYKVKTKIKATEAQKRGTMQKAGDIEVPDDYVATEVSIMDPIYSRPDRDGEESGSNIHGHSVNIAGYNEVEGYLHSKDRRELDTDPQWSYDRGSMGVKIGRVDGDSAWSEKVPFNIYAEDSKGFTIGFLVLCERTPEIYEEWQLETYKSIMKAYREQRSEYEERVSAARIQDGVEISGQNPDRNREIEQTELKRSMMSMLKGGPLYPNDDAGNDDDDDDDIGDETPITRTPEIDIQGIEENADTIRFLEQAFEWTNMTYRFYPYFWAKEGKWAALSRIEDSDPTFASFLRAGAARVVVPVREGYEYHVPYFMRKGEPYSGNDRPTVGDPEYLSIIQDIKEQQNKLPDETNSVGDPWKVSQPTSLVKLQQGGSLDAGGN